MNLTLPLPLPLEAAEGSLAHRDISGASKALSDPNQPSLPLTSLGIQLPRHCQVFCLLHIRYKISPLLWPWHDQHCSLFLTWKKPVISSHPLLPWIPGRHALSQAFKQDRPCACPGISSLISPAGSASPSSLTLDVFETMDPRPAWLLDSWSSGYRALWGSGSSDLSPIFLPSSSSFTNNLGSCLQGSV